MRRQARTGPGHRCRASSEHGAGLAEFALVLPVLLVILFGIVEFGVVFSRSQAVEAAAREGGRLASLSSTTSVDVSNRVDAALAGIPFDAPHQVSVAPPAGCYGRQGESVTVVVSAPHRIAIPLVVDTTLILTGRSVFRCEA